MNKLHLSPVLAATVAATVCTHPNQALAQGMVTVSYTNTSPISDTGVGNDVVSFSEDIPSADELLSISGGSLSGGEGASFTLSVQYANSSTQQIYSHGWNIGETYALTSIPSESFATGDINGLVFDVVNGSGGPPIVLNIPAGTVFTFNVPEPVAGALLLLGGAGIWALARRKTN
jgi:hypothetical protein